MILKTALSSHLADSKIEDTAVLRPVSFPVMIKNNHLVISTHIQVVFWPIIYVTACVIFLNYISHLK